MFKVHGTVVYVKVFYVELQQDYLLFSPEIYFFDLDSFVPVSYFKLIRSNRQADFVLHSYFYWFC